GAGRGPRSGRRPGGRRRAAAHWLPPLPHRARRAPAPTGTGAGGRRGVHRRRAGHEQHRRAGLPPRPRGHPRLTAALALALSDPPSPGPAPPAPRPAPPAPGPSPPAPGRRPAPVRPHAPGLQPTPLRTLIVT